MAAFLVFTLLFDAYVVSEQILREKGPVFLGKVTNLDVDMSEDGHGYQVSYSFQFGKETISDAQSVDEEFYKTLQVGDSIQIQAFQCWGYYFTVIRGESLRAFTIFQAAMAAFCSFIVVGVVWGAWFRPRGLIRIGEPRVAKVTSKRIVEGEGRDFFATVTYDQSPDQTTKKEFRIPARVYNKTREGAEVIILFDPQKPKRRMIYDTSMFMAG